MPTLKTEYECPACAKSTGASNQILANAGELQCSVNSIHKWNDTQKFMDERPRMVFKVAQLIAQQANRAPLTIPVPIKLKADLEDKYGDKLIATAVAVLSQMAEGTAMLVPFTDVERLQDRLNHKFQNSSELVGLVYSSICQVDDAKAERDTAIQDLKAYEGLSVGRVVIDLGDQYMAAKAKAVDASMPLKLWVEEQFKNMIANNWI